MKTSKSKKAITILALLVTFLCTAIPCFADQFSATLGYDYSIPDQASFWNGKEESCFWNLSSTEGKECRFNVSILSTQNVSIVATLKTVVPLWFDGTVKTLSLSGSQNAWTGQLFNPDVDETYYAYIAKNTANVGCNGRVSVSVP